PRLLRCARTARELAHRAEQPGLPAVHRSLTAPRTDDDVSNARPFGDSLSMLKHKEKRRGLTRAVARPQPDEAPLAAEEHDGGPPPQPERREPKLADPGLRDLSFTDYKAIVIRAAK